jgi:hypothetical protein
MMSLFWFVGWSNWPVSMVTMAIAGSWPCFTGKAGE